MGTSLSGQFNAIYSELFSGGGAAILEAFTLVPTGQPEFP